MTFLMVERPSDVKARIKVIAITSNGCLEVIKCCIWFFEIEVQQPSLMPSRSVVRVEADCFV
jgi:hypothetical protein